jgi:Flp pilus assembly pilin Flp
MRSRIRSERGAATAEYVGALVVVAALVLALVAVATPLGGRASAGVSAAYCKITSTLGGAGCSNDELPGYIPTECTVSSHEGAAGGSVKIVIIEVGADGSYELAEVRRRNDDGTYSSTYVLTTKLGGNVGVDVSFGGGGEVQTGEGSANASAEAGVSVALEGAGGKSYEFGSEAEARDAVDAWLSQNDANPFNNSDIDGDVETEYYTGGVRIGATGEAGPLSGEAEMGTIVGYTEHKKTGDRTISLVTDQSVAAELGLPIPEEFIKASASGQASRELGLQVTYDKDGRLVGVQVTLVGTVQGSVGVGIDTDQVVDGSDGALEDLTLPTSLDVGGGRQFELTYSADFRNPDGSVNEAAYGDAGYALAGFISTGALPMQSNVEFFRDYLNENSQVVFNTYDYNEDESQYGGEIKVGPVALGGEVHISTTDRNILSGYYYDPVLQSWAERLDCAS